MLKGKTLKMLCSGMAVLLLLGSSSAFAERPREDSTVKGSVPAQSTLLEPSAYADASLYDNPPPQVKVMRIGLMYGDSADAEAEIKNLGSGGFKIGLFDENRKFQELEGSDADKLTVRISSSGGSWRALLEEPASHAVGTELPGGRKIELDGEKRVIYGKFSSRGEAESFIEENNIQAEAFYDGSGSIALFDGDKLIYKTPEGVSSLALMPEGAESLCEFKKNHYLGAFEFRMHDASHLCVINYVELEDYIKGVIPYEMDYSWPIEALKAQAVCARTYAVYNVGRFSYLGFDLTADTYSQVYRGTIESRDITDEAVEATAGELIRYKGEICEVYYCSSNGGATEDGTNVFESPAPYLAGKQDPFEEALDYPLKNWEVRKSEEQILSLLAKRNSDISDISRIEPLYSDTGNVISLRYYDKNENFLEITGRSCYTSLGLNSCRFSVSRDGDDFVFTGKGWGHSCGMSQWGAKAMASVYGFDYQDILRFYFSGVYII